MIELFYWTTPNGHKITMFLEEAELPYTITPINIGKGEQFQPDFLQIAPNNRIPAIVDHDPIGGGNPISLFESGAILVYLAEKVGMMPTELRDRTEVLQWLFWQMGGLGPMAGQNHHFSQYAPEKIPYAIERYVKETGRLYAVMNKRLSDREFLAGNFYSIADMASYPWIVPYERQGQNLDDFPHLKRWFEAVRSRPSTIRAYDKAEAFKDQMIKPEEARSILFNQSASTVQTAPK
jgi:GST-like protein